MTPGLLLAYVVAGWAMVLITAWFVYVAIARWRALAERAELNRRKLEAGVSSQERQLRLLGAVAEGEGLIPSDAQEAVLEAAAVRRMQGR